MIDKIKKIIELKDELREEYGIHYVAKHGCPEQPYAQLSYEDFINLFNEGIKEERFDSIDYPIKLKKVVDEILFFTLLTEEEYEKYKNSRATNTTK